jgi:DNA-binding MarR family transcriptional regulator
MNVAKSGARFAQHWKPGLRRAPSRLRLPLAFDEPNEIATGIVEIGKLRRPDGLRLVAERNAFGPQAHDAAIRAWSHFLGAHALALRAVEQRLSAAGEPPLAWYDVLLELGRAGGGLRIGELGERIAIEPHNVTRLVDRLEAEGLLKRERAPEDRRGVFVLLTQNGAALRKRMWPHYRRAILEVFGAALSTRDAETLIAVLKKTIEHLRKQRPTQAAKNAGAAQAL